MTLDGIATAFLFLVYFVFLIAMVNNLLLDWRDHKKKQQKDS